MDVLPARQDNATPLKMVFAVNSELKMGVGKIAAQVAHAGLAIQKKIFLGEERMKRMLTEWEEMGLVLFLQARDKKPSHTLREETFLERNCLIFG